MRYLGAGGTGNHLVTDSTVQGYVTAHENLTGVDGVHDIWVSTTAPVAPTADQTIWYEIS